MCTHKEVHFACSARHPPEHPPKGTAKTRCQAWESLNPEYRPGGPEVSCAAVLPGTPIASDRSCRACYLRIIRTLELAWTTAWDQHIAAVLQLPATIQDARIRANAERQRETAEFEAKVVELKERVGSDDDVRGSSEDVEEEFLEFDTWVEGLMDRIGAWD